MGACHLYALTLNPSPKIGRGTLSGFSPLLPIINIGEACPELVEGGGGDEGNTGICKRDMLPSIIRYFGPPGSSESHQILLHKLTQDSIASGDHHNYGSRQTRMMHLFLP